MDWRTIVLAVGVIAAMCAFQACFTADKEPDDESDGPTWGSDDDDDGGDDDNGDDAADDAADDDGADDDADDDAGDDDTQVSVDCEGILSLVYDECLDAFEDKVSHERLNRDEALAACEGGGAFWQCVQGCVDEAADLVDGRCSSVLECTNEREDCGSGSLFLADVPE